MKLRWSGEYCILLVLSDYIVNALLGTDNKLYGYIQLEYQRLRVSLSNAEKRLNDVSYHSLVEALKFLAFIFLNDKLCQIRAI